LIGLRTVTRGVRTGLLAASRYSGLGRFTSRSRWRQRRLLILCYHGVSLRDEHLWHPELFVTRDFLIRRFEIIRSQGYTVLPLPEAVARLRVGTLPERGVVLTFDDGFYDFYAAAAPILQRFDFPATVYLSTYHCLHQRPILGLTLPYLLWRARDQVPSHGLHLPDGQLADLSRDAQRATILPALLEEARALSADRDAQLQWMEALSYRLQVSWQDIMATRVMHLMTGAEVAAVSSQGIDVQLHTHRHQTPTTKDSFFSEILENQRVIRNFTGKTATHFCYPSGIVQPEYLPWLHELKTTSATTCEPQLASARTDPLLLPRFIDTLGQSELYFESWLSGMAGFLGGAQTHGT